MRRYWNFFTSLPTNAFNALIYNTEVRDPMDPSWYRPQPAALELILSSRLIGGVFETIFETVSGLRQIVADKATYEELGNSLVKEMRNFNEFCEGRQISSDRIWAVMIQSSLAIGAGLLWLWGEILTVVVTGVCALIVGGVIGGFVFGVGGLVIGGVGGLAIGGTGSAIVTDYVVSNDHENDLAMIEANYEGQLHDLEEAQGDVLTSEKANTAAALAKVAELEARVLATDTKVAELTAIVDADGDGINLPSDLCPDSRATVDGESVNVNGCWIEQIVAACGDEATITAATSGEAGMYVLTGCALADADQAVGFLCRYKMETTSYEDCIDAPG